MVRTELVQRSPLRILEKSTHGGLGKGNLGVLAARKGVGKTAVLVHLATDQLFQGKHVIHVSFSSKTSHIVDWYEDIFNEIARRHDLEQAISVHDDLIKNRVIMNFNQAGISTRQITNSLQAMITEGQFDADLLVVDTYDFTKATVEDLEVFREFAQNAGVEIWFSATLSQGPLQTDPSGAPESLSEFLEQIAVLILLLSESGYVRLKLIKDHDSFPREDSLHLRLDPKILLVSKED
jgi:hypothetical protein